MHVEVAVDARGDTNQDEVIAVSKTAQVQAGRDRAREGRLRAARERRLTLDPDELARGQRIDEAVVDVEVAWGARSEAEQAVAAAEGQAAIAIGRLLDERLAVKDVGRLTGIDTATVRRLRQLNETAATVGKSGGAPSGQSFGMA